MGQEWGKSAFKQKYKQTHAQAFVCWSKYTTIDACKNSGACKYWLTYFWSCGCLLFALFRFPGKEGHHEMSVGPNLSQITFLTVYLGNFIESFDHLMNCFGYVWTVFCYFLTKDERFFSFEKFCQDFFVKSLCQKFWLLIKVTFSLLF